MQNQTRGEWASRLLLGVFVLSCLSLTTCRAEPLALSCGNINKDYQLKEYKRYGTFSQQACRDECGADDACAMAAFNTKANICMLKENKDSNIYKGMYKRIGVNSYPKACPECIEENAKYSGALISKEGEVKAHSGDECKSRCSDISECQFFSFDLKTRDCLLYKSIDKSKTAKKEGVISGPELCKYEGWGEDDWGCVWNATKLHNPPAFKTHKSVKDVKACIELCRGDSVCELFSYNKVAKTCGLHLAIAFLKKSPDGAYTSGLRRCLSCGEADMGIDTTSKSKKATKTAVPNPEECQLHCMSYPYCSQWTYIESAKTCHLFVGPFPAPKKTVGAVTGPRLCDASAYIHGMTNKSNSALKTDTTTTSVQACQKLCKSIADCHFYTYEAKKKTCKVYDIMDFKYKAPTGDDVVLGERSDSTQCLLENATTIDGAVLSVMRGNNVAECRLKCRTFEECTRFNFSAEKKECYIIKGGEKTKEKTNYVAGYLDCLDLDNSCSMKDVEYTNGSGVDYKNVPSQPACREKCMKSTKCDVFEYTASNKICRLIVKTSKITIVAKKGFEISPKKCYKSLSGCTETKDYSGSDVKLVKTKDHKRCQQECAKFPLCDIYTTNFVGGKCWLKKISGWKNRRSHSQVRSGTRLGCIYCHEHYIFYEGPVVRTHNNVSHTFTCQGFCQYESKCKYFRLKGSKCELLTSVTGYKADNNASSGPRRC